MGHGTTLGKCIPQSYKTEFNLSSTQKDCSAPHIKYIVHSTGSRLESTWLCSLTDMLVEWVNKEWITEVFWKMAAYQSKCPLTFQMPKIEYKA